MSVIRGYELIGNFVEYRLGGSRYPLKFPPPFNKNRSVMHCKGLVVGYEPPEKKNTPARYIILCLSFCLVDKSNWKVTAWKNCTPERVGAFNPLNRVNYKEIAEYTAVPNNAIELVGRWLGAVASRTMNNSEIGFGCSYVKLGHLREAAWKATKILREQPKSKIRNVSVHIEQDIKLSLSVTKIGKRGGERYDVTETRVPR